MLSSYLNTNNIHTQVQPFLNNKIQVQTRTYQHNQNQYNIINYNLQNQQTTAIYHRIADHLTVIKNTHKQQMAIQKIINKGFPNILQIDKLFLKKLRKQDKNLYAWQKKIIEDLIQKQNLQIQISQNHNFTYKTFYMSYITQIQKIMIYYEGQIAFIKIGIYQKMENQQLNYIQEILQKNISKLTNGHLAQLYKTLTTYTIKIYLKNDKIFAKNFIINNLNDYEQISDESKQQLLEKNMWLDYEQTNEKKIKISDKIQLINIFKTVIQSVECNSIYAECSLIKIYENKGLIYEFSVKNEQLKIYEYMKKCLKLNISLQFQYRLKFPCDYYTKIYENIQNLPNNNGLNFYQKLKIVKYGLQMTIQPNLLLNSQYKNQIYQIQQKQFENYFSNTFIIYILVLPLATKKTDIIQQLKSKIQPFKSTTIILKKKIDTNLTLFDSYSLRTHIKKPNLFNKSKYSFIFIDYPFTQTLPQIVHKVMHQNCPPKIHYKIFHIIPFCKDNMIFYHEKLDRNIQFPFSLELMIYSLRNIQARKNHEGLNGNGIQSLSKGIHYICSVFKNLNPKSYKNSRQRLIEIKYDIKLQQMNESIGSNLETLFQVSYKKQYMKNENILYYFLEQIENLYLQEVTSIQSICEQILSKTFKRLPFYDIC